MKRLLLLLALTTSQPVLAQDADELDCLARNIYHEARGESYKGQVAVGYVTMNRVKSKRFPNTICKVVYQKSQFSWTLGKPKEPSGVNWYKALDAAGDIIDGSADNPIADSDHYYANKGWNAIKSPHWWKARTETYQIGNHIFTRLK